MPEAQGSWPGRPRLDWRRGLVQGQSASANSSGSLPFSPVCVPTFRSPVSCSALALADLLAWAPASRGCR